MSKEKWVELYKALVLLVGILVIFGIIVIKMNDYRKDAAVKAEIYTSEGNSDAAIAYTELIYLYEGTNNPFHRFELKNVYDNVDALMKVGKYKTGVEYLDSYVYDYNRSKWEE